jgi:hypothetical protein
LCGNEGWATEETNAKGWTDLAHLEAVVISSGVTSDDVLKKRRNTVEDGHPRS